MSAIAATFSRPIYDRNTHRKGVESMATQANNQQLRPELEKVVEDILGLRALATATGYMTFKSQKQILDRLTPEDAAIVGHELARRQQKK
jgi:hypothetical protein